jgi:hypothetical protein
MRRRRSKWRCWLCPAWGWIEHGQDGTDTYEAHYAEKHRGQS